MALEMTQLIGFGAGGVAPGIRSYAVMEATRSVNFQTDMIGGPPQVGDAIYVFTLQQGTTGAAPSPAGWLRDLNDSGTTADTHQGGEAMHMKRSDGTEGSVTFINGSSTLEVGFALCLMPRVPFADNTAVDTATVSNEAGISAGESGDVSLALSSNTPIAVAVNFAGAYNNGSPDMVVGDNQFPLTPDLTLSATDGSTNLRAFLKVKVFYDAGSLSDTTVGMSGGDHGGINSRMSMRVQL